MGRTTSILTKPPRTFLLFFIPSSLISTVISPPFFANPMLITYLETPKKPHSHLSFFVSRRPPFAPSTFPICFLSLPYGFLLATIFIILPVFDFVRIVIESSSFGQVGVERVMMWTKQKSFLLSWPKNTSTYNKRWKAKERTKLQSDW